jgi:hypothetical protein
MRLPRLCLFPTSLTTIAIAVIGLSSSLLGARAQNPAERRVMAADRQLAFEPNMGQAAADVGYLARTAHYTAFLKENGAAFRIDSARSTDRTNRYSTMPDSTTPTAVITMTFAGANPGVLPVAGLDLGGRSN